MRLVRVVTSTRSCRASRSADLVQQVVHLAAHRADVHLGIHQAGGPDDLLDDDALREPQLEIARRGGDVDHLRHQRHELVELQRPVVERRRQAEAVLDQGQLAGPVAVEHPADLRQRHVRLVHHDQEVGREVVEQAGGALAGPPAAEMARVVLDPGAGADLEQHLDVEVGARLEPLRLEQLPRALELGQPLGELGADGAAPRARSWRAR